MDATLHTVSKNLLEGAILVIVVLLLLHECGHLIAARQFGLNVGAPVFIPFMGAFIALQAGDEGLVA